MKHTEITLKNLLAFNPNSGLIQLMGHRILLVDSIALGLHRKELIDYLGTNSARNILTRTGYAHGWATADNLSNEYPELLQEGECGPRLHMLQGLVTVEKIDVVCEPEFRMIIHWQDSYEAEQHLLHMGISHEPACWSLTGYVSGYASRMFGTECYCIEDHCCAKGDSLCRAETRTREGWGSAIEPHLPFFQSETIGSMLLEVRSKLIESENIMKKAFTYFSEANDDAVCGMIATSKVMRKTLDLAKRIARVDSSVVITGESGVGKERIARIIHNESTRATKPFVAINCGAVTETLLESEFFGHARGAFTGANRDRIGLFEAAGGGTLFLDEVGEIPSNMQAKLLRALQEREIRRIGENKSRPVDVRIIAATNRTLADEVAVGNFREDLYYRLHVFELNVPPLRDRPEDILALARYFLDKASQKFEKDIVGFHPVVADRLLQLDWPGNVRQLENVIEHAVVLCQTKRIGIEDLPKTLHIAPGHAETSNVIKKIDDVVRDQILTTLKLLNNNKVETAKQLGISLSTLYQKLGRYGQIN